MESAEEWDRCLGWTFELISEDPVRRERARGRLRVTQDRRSKALYAFNEVWRDEGLSAADQAGGRYVAERRRTLPDALWEFIPAESYADWGGLKYVLLYLEWEARYPDEWMASAKSWGTKHGQLHDLARAVPYLATELIDQLVDLICLAVRREHRCEDEGYAVLARAVGGLRLRRLLLEIADDPDEGFRLRARYLLWLLDHPEAPKPKVSQWKAWLRSREADPVSERAEPVA
ncbi:hypothetical protein ACIBF7_41505 [Nonomuraea sp. NPDC050478]